MTITPLQAKAELARRGLEPSINLTAEEARAELKRRGVEPEEGTSIARGLAQGLRNTAAGAGDLADFVFTPLEAARYGAKYAAHKIAPKYVDKPEYGLWNTYGDKIAKGIDEATQGYTKNTGLTESLGRGLATLPLGAGAGKALVKYAPKVGTALMNMHMPTAANIGSVAGGTALAHNYAHNIAEDDPSMLGLLGAGITGSVLGGYGGAGAARTARGTAKALTRNPKDTLAEWVGSSHKFDPALYEKGKALGLPASMGMATESTTPLGAELLLHKYPATADVMEDILHRREQALAKNLGVTESDLTKAIESPKHYLAKQGAAKYKETKSKAYEQAIEPYKPLEDQLLQDRLLVNVDDVLNNIKSQYGKGVLTPSEVKGFKKSFPGHVHEELLTSLKENAGSNHLKGIQKELEGLNLNKAQIDTIIKEQYPELASVQHQEGVSLRRLRDLRDDALNKVNNTKPGSPEHAEATAMHKLLRDKVTESIEPHATPEQMANRTKANREYAEYASKKQSNMKKYVEELVNVDGEKQAFDRLTTHPKYLEAASRYLDPNAKRDLAEAIMVTEGKNRSTNRFNIAQAQTAYSGWDPAVQRKFLSLLPTAKAKDDFLDTIKYIADNKTKLSKIANTSNTAHTTTVIQRYKDMFKALSLTGLATIGFGGSKAAVSALGSLAGADVLARIGASAYTDPIFLDRINRVIKAKNAKALSNNFDLLLKAPSMKQILRSATIESTLRNNENEEHVE